MKKYILIILIGYAYSNAVSQHNINIVSIKHYYHSINKEKLIDTMLVKYMERCKEVDELFESSAYTVNILQQNKRIVEQNKNLANIRNDSSIIVPAIKFKNVVDYSFDKNIYDFLCIDSAKIEIRYYHKQKEEVTVLNMESLRNIEYSGKNLKNLRYILDIIEKEKTEILLVENWVFSDSKSYHVNYLFLKENKIYVYRSKYKDVHELNQFVHKFFKEKEFKGRAILNEKGYILVG
jgi:hypothetical protein